MGLTKEQLEQLNNNSFPNNNSGYITPDILRTYNSSSIAATVNQDVYSADSASFNYRLQNFNPDNLVTTATFNAYTSSNNTALSSLSQSYIAFTASYYQTSASFDSRINNFNPTNLVTTASFNAYTQSVNIQLANIEAATGSYLTTGSTTSNQYVSGNLSFTEVNTFVTQSTANNVNTHNGGTLEFLAGNISNTYPSLYDIVGFGSSVWSTLRVSGAGLSTPLISNMFISGANNVYVTIAAGNSVSGSSYSLVGPIPQNVDFKVNNLIVSGNIVTNGTVNTNTIGANSGNKVTISSQTASVNRLEATNISSSIVSASFVTAVSASAVSASFGFLSVDSASITYLKVIYETSSVVFSSGSNIFGDNANDDVQTLIGRTKVTGSLEVTGSSSFNGNQTISGSLTISGSSTTDLLLKGQMFITGGRYSQPDAPSLTLQGYSGGGDLETVVINGLNINISRSGSSIGGDFTAAVYSTNISVYDNINGNSGVLNTNQVEINGDANGNAIGLTSNNSNIGGTNNNPALYTYDNNGNTVTLIEGQTTTNWTDGQLTYTTPARFNSNINVTGSAIFTELTGSLGAYSASVSSRITNNSSSLATLSSSFTQTSSSLNVVSSSLNVVSSSLNVVSSSAFAVSGAFAITSASLNTVSSSYSVTSASYNNVSSSFNTMSASAVSNVTDTYTSEPLAKYIVTLTTAEYASIVTPNTNTLYITI